MKQPVILCGLGRVGWRVLEYLRAAGFPVIAIDTHCSPNDPRLEKVRLVRGDCRNADVLKEAGVTEARGVLVLTSNDLVNISTALMVRNLHPEVRVVIRVFNHNLIGRLGKAVHNVFALSTAALTAPLLSVTALAGQSLGAYRLGTGGAKRQVAEMTIAAGSPLLGRTVADATSPTRSQVVAHFPMNGLERYLLDVNSDAVLRAGDRVIVTGEPNALAPLLAQTGDEAAPHLLWAGWLRRMGRVAWRTLAEMDWAVQVSLGVLLSVVFISTLVFRLGVDKYDSTANAFYRTISIMATGADMGETYLEAGWQKVFVGMLRLLGAALTAAFTALFTNYLIRARLGGALEIRRIPDSGHIIVCGLGNIGYSVIEELVRGGERVVVVESAADNRFVATVRRLGVAVIHGDATVKEVLRQAHSPTCRAVIAATTNDLVNLEVALLVREMNEKQRVVLCLSDAGLAQTLRQAANIRFALSVPALVAPAFVAALFGDRVQNLFLVGGRLLAVVDLVVQPEDTGLVGQTVRAVAVDYRLLPVTLLPATAQPLEQPLHARLSPGDRLIAFVALPDVERLLRREAVPHDCAVEVTRFPPLARATVSQHLRFQQGLSAEDADKALERLPVCMGEGLTRGQAEDLLTFLQKDRVTVSVRQGERVVR